MAIKDATRRFFERIKLSLPRHRADIERSPETFDRVSIKQNYSASQKRKYRIYVPGSYQKAKPLPLVMVLHGCLQDHLDIEAISQFDAIAEREGFIVVYPFVTRYTDIRARNCWGWWHAKHIAPGSGEVADLWHIVEEVAAEFSVDARRIHIAGLSAGGCMAVAALTVHVNRFASGAAIAALAYGETPYAVIKKPFANERRYKSIAETTSLMATVRGNDHSSTPLFIIHSHDDRAVHMQAAENLRDSWLAYFAGATELIQRDRQDLTQSTSWVHTRYCKNSGDSVVETLFLRGPGHGWYGGAPGKFSYPIAPPTAEMMWEFFCKHSLPAISVNSGVPRFTQQ